MTEPEIGALMTACAKSVVAAARYHGIEKPLFALLVFNDPEVAQYIANCERPDIIRALRECADRLERRESIERVPFKPDAGFRVEPG